jgi:predicted transcriptional regulator
MQPERKIPMAGEALKLMAQIVISHASTTELTPQELLKEIKEVYSALASLEAEVAAPAPPAPVARARKPRKVKMVESPVAKAIEDEDGLVFRDPDYIEFMDSREG